MKSLRRRFWTWLQGETRCGWTSEGTGEVCNRPTVPDRFFCPEHQAALQLLREVTP